MITRGSPSRVLQRIKNEKFATRACGTKKTMPGSTRVTVSILTFRRGHALKIIVQYLSISSSYSRCIYLRLCDGKRKLEQSTV